MHKEKTSTRDSCSNSVKIFKKKAYENQKDAMGDGLPYKGHNHREAIVHLFEIHDILPNLAEGGTKFENEDFYRNIIAQTMKPRACVTYFKRGDKNLRTEDKVLDLLEEIQEGIEVEQ